MQRYGVVCYAPPHTPPVFNSITLQDQVGEQEKETLPEEYKEEKAQVSFWNIRDLSDMNLAGYPAHVPGWIPDIPLFFKIIYIRPDIVY